MNKTIRRPWAGICLLAIIIATYTLWYVSDPHPFAITGSMVFWLAVAGFWIVPVRFISAYLFAAATALAVITILIATAPYPKPERPSQIAFGVISTGAAAIGAISIVLRRKHKSEYTDF